MEDANPTDKASEAKGHPAKERLWTPMFIGILVCTLACFLVGQGSNSGTTVYLSTIGLPVGLAGLGALFFSVSAAVARVFSGSFIDKRGRIILVSCGAAVMLCGCVGPLFVNEGAAFVVWRILQGAGFSAATTALSTAAADVLPFSRLGEGISYYGLGQAVAMSIGPAIAIALATSEHPQFFYIAIALCAAIVLAISLFLRYEKRPLGLPETSTYRIRYEEGKIGRSELEETEKEEKSHANALGKLLDNVFEPGAIPASLVTFFACGAFGFGIFYAGAFGTHLGLDNPGIFYVMSAIVMVLIRLLGGRMMDTMAPIKIMAISVVAGLVAFALFFACASGSLDPFATQAVYYAAGIPYGLCLGLTLPINQSMAVKMSPADRWGAANALMLLSVDVSNGIFSALWGFLAETFSYIVPISCVLFLLVCSLIAAKIVYPKND